MPVIEDILSELGEAKMFRKVDCKNGYWQINFTEECLLLTTLATLFGRYKWGLLFRKIIRKCCEFREFLKGKKY